MDFKEKSQDFLLTSAQEELETELLTKVVTIEKIQKRDGRIVEFNQEKVTTAIFKATVAVGQPDRELAKKLSDRVVIKLEDRYTSNGKTLPSVEEIQDIVEEVLMESGNAKLAKTYILYRQKRTELREAKKLLGVKDDLKLGFSAVQVLERRYLLKNGEGKVIETPSELFQRVSNAIALADLFYDVNSNIEETQEKFYKMMKSLEFVPNSPTMMNAGTSLGQLSACFVLPIRDNLEAIFDSVKHTALIHQSGGGTGFSFSRLRPKGDLVRSTQGVASGPISFMTVFDSATNVIKQGGKRRGANMAVLRVDHPDILEFITAKEKDDSLNNFNISVALTDKFMKAVEEGTDYELLNPRSKKVVKKLSARKVFDLIVTMAWKNGEPGIVFIDRINRYNPTPELGEIESTNPCGEQPLLSYESCNLGSINLSKMLIQLNGKAEIDWDKLKETVHKAVHFMDNVIDVNKYPLEEIERATKHGNRKIGLGVMGWADMLINLNISYDSKEALRLAEMVMSFVQEEADKASEEIAKRKGVFSTYDKSIYKNKRILRNATRTTIAPTGTISIIAGCSSGVEPLFAVSFVRNVMDNTELFEINPIFEKIAKTEGFYSPELIEKIAKHGSVQGIEEIPEKYRRLFVTAHDISPEWHVKMQAAFQKYTDNAVSKTVNFSNNATPQDVEKVYKLAYKLGCKGVTVYRDGSRGSQVLNIGKVNRNNKEKEYVPDQDLEEIPGFCPTCSI